ncbi:MAG: hypothetical protein HYW01_06465 [Deltaproteobacteria bacterium]|nr:hypothetical protein [Deltaproteobacteria bacterium]
MNGFKVLVGQGWVVSFRKISYGDDPISSEGIETGTPCGVREEGIGISDEE